MMRVIAMTTSLALAACATEPRKPVEMVPIGTLAGYVPKTPGPDQAETTPNSGMASSGDARTKDECLGAQFDNLEKAFARSDCDATPEVDAEMKGKLSIKVVPEGASVANGGHVRIAITITNDAQEKIPVYFRLDPVARVDILASDTKGKRVDLPTGKKPNGKEPDSRTARVTLMPGGVVKLTTIWEAVKRKWSTRNGKAAAVPAGPLPRGKYRLRIVPPLVGIRDMAEFSPQVDIDVGR